jgi:signal transduction histidine kinase
MTPGEPQDSLALLITDRMARLGTLVAGVAHEINNPITYVLRNFEDLGALAAAMREALLAYRTRMGELPGDEAAALITEIEMKVHRAGGLEVLDELQADTYEGIIRIRDLVRDLLEVSRSSDHSTGLVDVHEILDSSLRLIARPLSARATLEWSYQAETMVEADRAKLAQVFLNLITNAMHACEPPDPSRHRIRVCTRDTEDGIEVRIEDTGAGVPEEIRDMIFAPFFTTKEAGTGTGLGLYISRQIVEDHGGSLALGRATPTGATFTIRLPERQERSTPPTQEG